MGFVRYVGDSLKGRRLSKAEPAPANGGRLVLVENRPGQANRLLRRFVGDLDNPVRLLFDR